MRVSDKAIVLQSIKHGDKKYILRIFSKAHGSLSVLTYPGHSHQSKVRLSALLPLSLIDAEIILRQNKEIHQLTECHCYHVQGASVLSYSRLGIAQFLTEVFSKTLKEQAANTQLFEFVETCVKYLYAAEENYLNLHLYVLLELSKYLGFEPQNNFSANEKYFDCREGKFSSLSLAMPLGLSTEDSLLFAGILKQHPLKTEIDALSRKRLLDSFLAYYKLHLPSFQEVKSLEVFREMMAG